MGTLAFFFVTYLGVAAFVAGTTVAVLGLTVTRRITRLSNRVETIQSTRAFDARLDVKGNDEVARLAMEFNALLERLSDYTHDLQLANRELNDFASVISHDLKNPLNAIALQAYTWARSMGRT